MKITLKTEELCHETFALQDLIRDVYDRIDDLDDADDLPDAIWEAIDNSMIYTDDQWALLKEYCTPQNCDLNAAFEAFYDDCLRYISTEEDD